LLHALRLADEGDADLAKKVEGLIHDENSEAHRQSAMRR